MYKVTKLAFFIIAFTALIGLESAFALVDRSDSGRGSPVILSPSSSSIRVDTAYAFPGDDTVYVPVYFTADASDTIREFEFELTFNDDYIQYLNYSTVYSDWNGYIIAYTDSGNLEIQGYGDTLSGGSTYQLIELRFSVSEYALFEQMFNINFQPDVYFKKVGSSESFDPATENGWIATYSDSFWVNLADMVKGYSYQALDTGSAYKNTRYVEVLVSTYAAFPCSEFKFYVKYKSSVSDSGLIFAGYSNALYGAVAEIDSADSTLIRVDNSASPSTFDVSGSFNLLRLRFRVGDFHENYNADPAFDSVLTLEPSFEDDDYFQGGDYGYQFDLDSTTFFDGSVELPVYVTYVDVSIASVRPDSSITLPVRIRTSYWSQYYKTYVKYDSTYLALNDIDAETYSTVPENIVWSHVGTIGSYKIVEVEVDTLLETEYIVPNTYRTVFNMDFDPTISMLNNPGQITYVYIDTLNYINEVWDYFPEEYDTTHVKRYSSSGPPYFYPYSGYVRMHQVMLTADEDVSCVNDSAAVPVRIQWIDDDIDADSLTIAFEIDNGPLRYRGIIEDTTDFDIDWGAPAFYHDSMTMIVTGSFKSDELDGPGILLHLALSADDPDPEETIIGASEIIFWGDNPSFYFNQGSVLSCGKGGEIKNVIPTVPVCPSLAQNHPNPFNAVTNIAFNLPNDDRVTLDIYDILGRKVRRLFSEDMPAGDHNVIWDCSNDSGDEVCSGFYFYILSTASYQDTKKMLLLK